MQGVANYNTIIYNNKMYKYHKYYYLFKLLLLLSNCFNNYKNV